MVVMMVKAVKVMRQNRSITIAANCTRTVQGQGGKEGKSVFGRRAILHHFNITGYSDSISTEKIMMGIAGKTSTRCPPSLPVHDDVLLLVAHLHPVRDELQLLEDALQKFVIVRSEGQQCQIRT